MYKLYECKKIKSDIRGFWIDNTGKVYIDNIFIKTINNSFDFNIEKQRLFDAGEKTIFYIKGYYNHAYIEYSTGKIDILHNQNIIKVKTLSINDIKGFLKKHKGLTVFKDRINNQYIIDIKY